MAGHNYLVLRLEGPLQCWGERAKWKYRDTADFPTKSGVTGLIACAMALSRDNVQIGRICSQLEMAVRADRLGTRMVDYHTVSSYGLMTAERKTRNKKNQLATIENYCSYLQDASFLVALDGPAELLQQIAEALASPHWPIYLGRKSCVPSLPVLGSFTDRYASLDDLMRKYPSREARSPEPAMLVYQMDSPDGTGQLRSDCRVSSAERRFALRRTVIRHVPLKTIPLEGQEEKENDIV